MYADDVTRKENIDSYALIPQNPNVLCFREPTFNFLYLHLVVIIIITFNYCIY